MQLFTLRNAALAAAVLAAIGCSDERDVKEPAVAATPVLEVSRITPVSGPTAGTNTVTILGVNFMPAAGSVDGVMFGAVSGNNLALISDSQLTVDAPAQATGSVSVVVSNATTAESVTVTNGYTYFDGAIPPAPTVVGVSPTSGTVAGGNVITIAGSGFVTGMTVTVGGTAATSVVVLTGGSATAVVPAGTVPGVVAVAVNNGGGTSTLPSSYVYTGAAGNPAPTISTVNPISGTILGGTLVTIDGAAFQSTAVAKPVVRFATGVASAVTLVHAGRLTCVAPSGAAGLVSVQVQNPDGQSATVANAYTYITPSPTISSISPTNGAATFSHFVTITGTNFFTGITVDFGGTPAPGSPPYGGQNLTTIVVSTPAPIAPGTLTVTVTNLNGTPAFATIPYTFNPPPVFTGISPAIGSTLGGQTVTVTGSNFATTGQVSVRIGSNLANSVVVNGAGTQIVCSTPGAVSAGSANVVVTNPDGQNTGVAGNGAFSFVSPPNITSITPTGGNTTGGYAVTLTGSNFSNPVTSVEFGVGNPGAITSQSATQIVVTAPSGGGIVSVIVTNTDAQTDSINFTYSNTPTVASVAPTKVDTLGNIPGTTTPAVLTITGTNYAAGATVTVGGTPATGVSVVSATQITCNAPGNGFGTGQAVHVYNNPGSIIDGNNVTIDYVYDQNFQTRQFPFDTAAGIDCYRRWYVNCNHASFYKDLQNIGMQSWGSRPDSTPAPGTLPTVDQYAVDWIRAYILTTMNVAYLRNADGTGISGTSFNITFVGLPPASGNRGCGNSATDWSEMGIGGCNPSEAGSHPSATQRSNPGCVGGTVGTASYDSGNPTCNNGTEYNSNTDYQGCGSCGNSRGTFAANVARFWVGSSWSNGNILSPQLSATDIPYFDGTGNISSGRGLSIHNRLKQYARRLAFVTAHEVGHSLGLVANTTASSGGCSSGGGQGGGCSGSHNCVCNNNIMDAVAGFPATTTDTSLTFANPGCSSPSNLNTLAMLTTFVGLSP